MDIEEIIINSDGYAIGLLLGGGILRGRSGGGGQPTAREYEICLESPPKPMG
jgi:hypothetical protein